MIPSLRATTTGTMLCRAPRPLFTRHPEVPDGAQSTDPAIVAQAHCWTGVNPRA